MSHHRWVTKVLVGLRVENPQKALWTIVFMIVFGKHSIRHIDIDQRYQPKDAVISSMIVQKL